MHDILQAIIDLAVADAGAKSFPQDREVVVTKLWDAASPEVKSYIAGLSKEDLESLCIGEINDEGQRFIGGKWTDVPDDVDNLLENIMGEVYW